MSEVGAIHESMITIMLKLGTLKKNGENSAQHYKYQSADDLFDKLQNVLIEARVYYLRVMI